MPFLPILATFRSVFYRSHAQIFLRCAITNDKLHEVTTDKNSNVCLRWRLWLPYCELVIYFDSCFVKYDANGARLPSQFENCLSLFLIGLRY
jgi:hypothetical protein